MSSCSVHRACFLFKHDLKQSMISVTVVVCPFGRPACHSAAVLAFVMSAALNMVPVLLGVLALAKFDEKILYRRMEGTYKAEVLQQTPRTEREAEANNNDIILRT